MKKRNETEEKARKGEENLARKARKEKEDLKRKAIGKSPPLVSRRSRPGGRKEKS